MSKTIDGESVREFFIGKNPSSEYGGFHFAEIRLHNSPIPTPHWYHVIEMKYAEHLEAKLAAQSEVIRELAEALEASLLMLDKVICERTDDDKSTILPITHPTSKEADMLFHLLWEKFKDNFIIEAAKKASEI